MSDTTQDARTAARCARCGHPRAKHTSNPADGCTVSVWRNRKAGKGRTRQVRHDCDCRFFMEGD